ncbi:hypothetical protein NXS19_004181 [Fusarium pseudograminearum]|nr:hypothetical protein NXS19_004181 [Fusarium pseudograminearum]
MILNGMAEIGRPGAEAIVDESTEVQIGAETLLQTGMKVDMHSQRTINVYGFIFATIYIIIYMPDSLTTSFYRVLSAVEPVLMTTLLPCCRANYYTPRHRTGEPDENTTAIPDRTMDRIWQRIWQRIRQRIWQHIRQHIRQHIWQRIWQWQLEQNNCITPGNLLIRASYFLNDNNYYRTAK